MIIMPQAHVLVKTLISKQLSKDDFIYMKMYSNVFMLETLLQEIKMLYNSYKHRRYKTLHSNFI